MTEKATLQFAQCIGLTFGADTSVAVEHSDSFALTLSKGGKSKSFRFDNDVLETQIASDVKTWLEDIT